MEIWKDIQGWNGYYQVSNFGRVKSLSRIIIYNSGNTEMVKEKIRQLSHDSHGYEIVCLSKNQKHTTKSIHRLVAEAFLENTYNKKQVNHINGIKNDNRLENLEWCTPSENQLHNYYKLNRKKSRAWLNILNENHPRSKKVLCTTNGVTYHSIREAAKAIGCNESGICAVVNGKKRHIKNHKFKLAG